ncbi:thiol peroxidase [Citricoccus muralis]|uniref:Thiol peroxidase n=1 Tax=Citricoccus muralis TaxID=169134 RepID=A0ABY8H4X5_9MICC|nr:thiol peroxidase [Citricoccus muralis]WFP15707.1 thiol peroxidase [Citricoccus muralis]
MATTSFKNTPAHTVADLPAVGTKAPDVELVGTDLQPFRLSDHAGKTVVLNIFPSVDTGVCAASVRTFNQHAADLEDTVVLCVSQDLPFAQGRFCGAEGIENVVMGSAFRSDFGTEFGLRLADSPMAGLLARAVIVIDAEGTVTYTQLVPEITEEPDYDDALSATN